MITVSFDWHGTLDHSWLAKNLYSCYRSINRKSEVDVFKIWVVTRKAREEVNDHFIEKLGELGLTIDNVQFTNGQYKAERLVDLSVDIHYDDDIKEAEEYYKYWDKMPFSVTGNKKCQIIIVPEESKKVNGVYLPGR